MPEKQYVFVYIINDIFLLKLFINCCHPVSPLMGAKKGNQCEDCVCAADADDKRNCQETDLFDTLHSRITL